MKRSRYSPRDPSIRRGRCPRLAPVSSGRYAACSLSTGQRGCLHGRLRESTARIEIVTAAWSELHEQELEIAPACDRRPRKILTRSQPYLSARQSCTHGYPA